MKIRILSLLILNLSSLYSMNKSLYPYTQPKAIEEAQTSAKEIFSLERRNLKNLQQQLANITETQFLSEKVVKFAALFDFEKLGNETEQRCKDLIAKAAALKKIVRELYDIITEMGIRLREGRLLVESDAASARAVEIFLGSGLDCYSKIDDLKEQCEALSCDTFHHFLSHPEELTLAVRDTNSEEQRALCSYVHQLRERQVVQQQLLQLARNYRESFYQKWSLVQKVYFSILTSQGIAAAKKTEPAFRILSAESQSMAHAPLQAWYNKHFEPVAPTKMIHDYFTALAQIEYNTVEAEGMLRHELEEAQRSFSACDQIFATRPCSCSTHAES